MDEAVFTGLIDSIWSHLKADVVYLFTSPYERDSHNREQVREAYEHLATENRALTVAVPRAETQETTEFILNSLQERGLLAT